MASAGTTSELNTHATVERLVALAPGSDLLAVEANYLVVRAYGAITAAMEAYLAPFGLSPARLTLLRVLFEAPEHRLTMGQIRSRLNVTSTNVSKLVTTLERPGWVRRTGSPADRRVVHAELTAAGRAEFELRMPGTLQQMERLWAGVAATEKEQTIELLRKLWFSVQQAVAASAGGGSTQSPD